MALKPVPSPHSAPHLAPTPTYTPRAELKAAVDAGGGQGLNDFLDNLGLGVISQQLKELSLGELLDTPPPGVDEAIAIAKASVML